MTQTVLLIDDSSIDRSTYQRLLSQDDRQSYQVIEFDNGEAALNWCQENRADIILLDYLLPQMDGLEFLRRLHQQAPDEILPVILLTGVGNTAVAVEALKLGAQDYLDKEQVMKERLPQLVRSVAQQVQLKRQLLRQQMQQQIVSEIALQMQRFLDPQDALDEVTQKIRQFLQADRVLVYQFMPDWSGLVVSESIGSGWPIALGQEIQDTCFQQGAGLAYQQGRIWAMTNLEQANLTDCHRNLMEQFAVKANLVVPILQATPPQSDPAFTASLWGLLIVHHCAGPHEWEAEEIAFVQQVAIQLAGAIQQAALYQQTQAGVIACQQAELALQESEARLRLAQAASKSGVWDWDLVTNQIFWSPEYYQLYNLDPSIEPNYETWMSCIHPDDREIVNQQTLQAIDDPNLELRTEFRVAGTEPIRWFAGIGQVLRNAAGEPIRVIGITIDITKQKQAEQALQASAKQFHRAVLACPFPIKIHAEDGEVLLINQTWTDLTGYTQAEMPTIAAWTEKAYGDRKDEIQEMIRARFALEHRSYVGEFFPTTKSGETRIWDFYAAPLGRLPDGRRFIISTAVDCTEQRLAQTQLQAILDSSEIVVSLKDRQGKYLLVNQKYEMLTGMKREAMLGKTDFDLFPPEIAQVLQDNDQLVLEVGESLQFQETVPLSGGSRTYLALKFPLHDANGRVYAVCGMSTDITELKQAQEALRQSNEQLQGLNQDLERANQAKDAFLRMMNHELRTPLNPILGMAEGLQEEAFGPLNIMQEQAVSSIIKSGEHLMTLITNILDLVDLESGKISLHRRSVLIQQLCTTCIAAVSHFAKTKSIHLQTQIAPGVDQVQVDEQRMQQVLTHLLDNAIKFTPNGGTVTLSVQLSFGIFPPNPTGVSLVEFSIRDSGIGIAPENLRKLFQFFTQIDDRLARNYEGIGVGLALTRHLVGLHGGHVSVASQLGQGSCFTVKIPA